MLQQIDSSSNHSTGNGSTPKILKLDTSRLAANNLAIEAEKNVLGAIVNSADDALKILGDRLTPADFSYPPHQTVFATLLEMAGECEPIDLMSLTSRLIEKGNLDRAGGQVSLSELLDIDHLSSFETSIGIILKESKERRLVVLSSLVQREGTTPEARIEAIEEMSRIATGQGTKGDLLGELQRLAAEEAKPSVVKNKLRKLGDKHGIDPKTISNLFEEITKEHQLETLDKPAQQTALQAIAAARTAKLDISKVLDGDGGYFARKLEQTALSMPTNPSWLFTTLVPVLGSLISPKQKILIKPRAGYDLTAVFRSLIIANTGSKKTPAQNIVLKPLWIIEILAAEKFLTDQEQYQQELREYDRLPKDSPEKDTPPTPPKRQRVILSDTTPEAAIAIHQENPEGFLLYRDEGSAFYTALNKYRSGKGDDCELDLSEFNGKPISVDRKSGGSFISTPHISRTGSTQTETFADLMGNFGDAAGYWARWLIDLSPAPASFISLEDDEDNGFSDDLTDLYQWIISQAPQDTVCYGLSIEAKKLWQEFQNELVRKQIETDLPGLANVYPKLETYFGRFCLLLHLTNAALGKRSPEPMISVHTVKQAAILIRYYEAQWILLHQANTPDNRSLTEPMLKIHEYALRKGTPLAVREIKAGLSALRKTESSVIKSLLESLGSTPGYGVWDGSKYSATQQNVENVDVLLINDQHTQSLINHGVESFVDDVDQKNQNFKTNNSTSLEKKYLKEFDQHSQQIAASPPLSDFDRVDQTSTKHQQTSTFCPGGYSHGDRVAFFAGNPKQKLEGTVKGKSGYFLLVECGGVTYQLEPEELTKIEAIA